MPTYAHIENKSHFVFPLLKQISTEGTGRVVTSIKPLVEAVGVELLATGAARQLGQLVVGAVQDVVANVALLDALEPLVHVALPQQQSVQN